jgi:hypothetical protein
MAKHQVAGYEVVGQRAMQLKAGAPIPPLCGVQTWICALSALSGFLFGYDLCVMVVALPLIQQVTKCVDCVAAVLPCSSPPSCCRTLRSRQRRLRAS